MNLSKIITILIVILFAFIICICSDEIHDATREGDLSNVKNLLKKEPKLINTKDENGRTPLHWAARGVHKAMIALLIEKGADVNMVDNNSITALISVAYRGNKEAAELLIKKGAEINLKDNEGWTALHCAADRGHKDVAELLIEKGAKVEIKDNNDETPLYKAVINGRSGIVELLFSKRAKLNINAKKKLFDRSLLHLASIKGYKEVADILIANGADVNAKDKYGKIPLYYAAKYGHKKIADILIKKGAVAHGLEENYGYSLFLQKELKEKEAIIWYLGHSGWAVKTKNHLLIFDYWKRWKKPTEPLLANGYINPAEIKDQNIYVFVSHEHHDHFDQTIFEWEKSVDNITYIFGWKAVEDSKYICLTEPRAKRKFGDIEVLTINHDFSEVPESAFLIKVDGLTIFHSGDHGNWDEGFNPIFKGNIDYLTKKASEFDLIFLKSMVGERGRTTTQGNLYTIEKWQPKVTFPMHMGGREHLLKEFAQEAAKKNFKTKIICAENRGDRFFYKNGKIE